MMIRWHRFNIYLALALVLGLACGCNSVERRKKKSLSTLRFHMEIGRDRTGRSQEVAINRSHPIVFTIDKVQFVDESSVKEAKVIEDRGGFALEIQFDQQGTWLLEQYTTANRERHIAIFSQFPTPPEYKLGQGRWLAAPKVSGKVTDGKMTFTPDASREEADLIVLGLNNVAKDLPRGAILGW